MNSVEPYLNGANGQVFTGSNIGTTGKKLEGRFSSRFFFFFFWVERFFSKFQRSWHMVVWQGLVVWCFFLKLCFGPSSNFSPYTDVWRAANGSNLELFAWNRSYGQMVSPPQPTTPTFTTSRFRSALQVHHPKFQSPILRPGETYKHHSWHVFKVQDLVFLEWSCCALT